MNRCASDSRPRPLKKRERDGAETARMIARSAITRINSMSVNAPLERRHLGRRLQSPVVGLIATSISLLPVGDVVFRPFLAVESRGGDVIRAGVAFAGALVNVRSSPRIIRYAPFFFEIRPAPILGVIWFHDQGQQTLLAARVITVVHFERA